VIYPDDGDLWKMSLDISLDRVDRIYSLGDKVRGSLVVQSDGFAHSGFP